MATDMERRQQGEQMTFLNHAPLPESPSFPNRLAFAGGGFAAGLFSASGSRCGWSCETSRSAQKHDEASLQMPALVSVPWLTGESANGNGNGEVRNFDRAQVCRGDSEV